MQLLKGAKEHILNLFDISVDVGLDFLKAHSSELPYLMPGTSVVQYLCNLFGALLKSIPEDNHVVHSQKFATATVTKFDAEEDDNVEDIMKDENTSIDRENLFNIYIPNAKNKLCVDSSPRVAHQVKELPVQNIPDTSLCLLISKIYVFAYTWAFGGCFERTLHELMEYESFEVTDNLSHQVAIEQNLVRGGITVREKFDALVYKLFTGKLVNIHLPSTQQLIYSYYFNLNTNSFEPWEKLLAISQKNVGFQNLASMLRYTPQLSHDFSQLQFDACNVGLIPTVDILRLTFLISVLLNFSSGSVPNILLSGRSGVGKSQLLSHMSKILASKKWQSLIISSVLGKSLFKKQDEPDIFNKEAENNSYATVYYHVSSQLEGFQMQSLLEKQLMRQGENKLVPLAGKSVCIAMYYVILKILSLTETQDINRVEQNILEIQHNASILWKKAHSNILSCNVIHQ